MSNHVISAVYKAKFGSPTRKSIALKLADCSNDDGGSIFMGVPRIARELEMADRTVQRVLKEFVEEGILIVVKPGGMGPKSTTHYCFDLGAVAALPRTTEPKGDTQSPLTETSRVTLTTAKGDTDDSKGDMESPNPSIPIKKEPSKESGRTDAQPRSQEEQVHVLDGEIIEPTAKAASGTKAKRSGRLTHLTDDWAPDPRGVAFGKERGLTERDMVEAFTKFKAHHQAKGSVMADWDAAWRTWVMNEVKFKAAPARGALKPGRFDRSACV